MRMLTTYIPTRSFASDLWNDMDRVFDTWNTDKTYNPACEAVESGDYFLISADVPGMKKDDIKIELSNEVLTISGEGRRTFKRSFTLPTTVDAEKIEAICENGVLELYLPKTTAAKPRSIQIKSGKPSFFEKLLGSKKTEHEIKDIGATKVS